MSSACSANRAESRAKSEERGARGVASGMESIDTYIIRIYRRDKDDPRNIAGLVEIIGGGERKTFTSWDELWGVLMHDSDGREKEVRLKDSSEE